MRETQEIMMPMEAIFHIINFFRQYMRGARCISELKLEDKVAIVTGGGSGIGKQLVIDLAKRGN